jgi:DNA-binding XRE family transcriptional regulator
VNINFMSNTVPSFTLGGVDYVVVPREHFDRAAGARLSVNMANAATKRRRELGERLKKARMQAKLTQVELGARIAKSQSMVARAENGTCAVGDRYTEAVMTACDLPANWGAAQGRRRRPKPRRR